MKRLTISLPAWIDQRADRMVKRRKSSRGEAARDVREQAVRGARELPGWVAIGGGGGATTTRVETALADADFGSWRPRRFTEANPDADADR